MDIYLVGHGYVLERGATRTRTTVPDGLTVRFYCQDRSEFDTTWEESVFSGAAAGKGFTPAQGAEEFEATVVAPEAELDDHLLTRPGAMKTCKSLDEMKEIQVATDNGTITLPAVVDKDAFCIKGGAKQMGKKDPLPGRTYAPLSDILAAFKEALGGTAATIHWCACRTDSDVSLLPEIIQQAQSPYLGKLVKKQ